MHEQVLAFQNYCTHPSKCTNLQILQKPVAKLAHGVSEYFPTNKDTGGNFQFCDVVNIRFKLEKPHVEHLEGFILLPKEGGKGKLQYFFKTLHRKL